MKIAYLSDLHLDFHRDKGTSFLNSLEFPQADLLVVAGDLCDVSKVNPSAVLKRFCSKYPHVLYVLGNHEYYQSTPRKTEDFIFDIANDFGNLTVAAQPKSVTLNGINILAGTMWFRDEPENVLYKKYIGDFSWIDLLEPRIYYDNKDFIKALEKRPDVVVSHHLPSPKSTPAKFAKSVINRFFVCDVENKIHKYHPKVWIHGHTHSICDYRIGDCRVLCNPFGYPYEPQANWKIETVDVDKPTK